MRCYSSLIRALRLMATTCNTILFLSFVLLAACVGHRTPPADWQYKIYHVPSNKTMAAKDMDSARQYLHAVLNDHSAIKRMQFHTDIRRGVSYKTAAVDSEKIVFIDDGQSVVLMLEELAAQEVYVENFWAFTPVDAAINYRINISNLANFYAANLGEAKRLADALYSVGYYAAADHLADLEVQASRYRALSIKPKITEVQRKYIVQANAHTQKKEYELAIDAYRQALKIDAYVYPAAYFNLALLSAELKRHPKAIQYMRQYLLFASDAKDARSAQDKIYEWEALQGK